MTVPPTSPPFPLSRPRRFVMAAVLIWGSFTVPGGLGRTSVLWAQEPPIPLDTLQVRVGSRVSPSLPVLTRSVQVLGREEIHALPVRTLHGLLEWATGVEVLSRSPAQSDISLRGAGFEQVVVLVDGVRMSDPQTGHHDLNLTVPLDRVERVEILRGPASALYGADAVGGVVNVVTTAGREGLSSRLEGGTWGTARVSLTGGKEGGAGSFFQAGGELSRSEGHREGTDFEAALLNLSGVHPLGGGWLSAGAGFARRDFGAQDFYAPFPSFERTRTFTSSLRWSGYDASGGPKAAFSSGGAPNPVTGEGSGGWSLAGIEAGLAFRRHEDEFILVRTDPDLYRNRHSSSRMGGDLLARWSEPRGLDLALGAELFRDRLRSNSLGNRSEDRGALFGEAALGWGTGGVLSLGVRGDWHEGFGAFVSPSLSGSWRLGTGLRLRAATGRSFRAPTWTERYYRDPVNVGRDDLGPERAWSGEVGVDVFRGSNLRFSLTGFARRAEGLIDWARPEGSGDDVPWETRNVESATFRGVEADFSAKGPWGSMLTMGAAFLSLSSAEVSGFRSKYALRPLKERVTLGVERTFGDWISLTARAQRGRRPGEDAYHRVDFRVAVRNRGVSLYLDAVNLLDASFPDVTGAEAPGRALFLGVEVGRPR